MRRLIKMLLSDSLWTALLLAAGAGCFVLGAWLLWQGGRAWSRGIDRQQAINNGVGRWIVDERTGQRTFIYGPAPAASPAMQQPSGSPPVKPLTLDPYNDASGPSNGIPLQVAPSRAPIFADPPQEKKEKAKK